MQIIVLGAGAIGGLFGAKLAAQYDVTLIARAHHVRAINENGLRIEGLESRTVWVRASERIDRIEADTLILLTTKVPATAAALSPIVSLVREDTVMVCLQNGLNSEAVARAALADRCLVLRGITQFGAIFERPAVIKYMAEGYTLIEQHERSARIVDVLNTGGLNARISADIRRDVWHKLILNCVVNPITTIIGSEVGAIADSRLDELKQLVIDECLAVATAEGIEFETDFQREIRERYAPSHNIVSMRQDLDRGRATEIDYLNGAVAALGSERGIECPVNRALTAIIKAMEARSRSLLPEKMLEAELA